MCPGSDQSNEFSLDAFFSQEAQHRSGGNLTRVVQKFHGMPLFLYISLCRSVC